jgi:hypothetical protein
MTQRKRWKELAPMQKAGALVMMSVQVSLLVSALVDIRQRPAAEIRGSKWLWTAISFVNFIGPISYFLFGRKAATPSTPAA